MTTRARFSLVLPDSWDEVDAGTLTDHTVVDPLIALTPIVGSALAVARTEAPPILAANLALPIWADDETSVAGLLTASLLVTEGDGSSPDMHLPSRITTIELEGKSCDVVVAQHLLRDPAESRYAIMTFTTPNTPLREQFEGLFERIAASAAWVAPTV